MAKVKPKTDAATNEVPFVFVDETGAVGKLLRQAKFQFEGLTVSRANHKV